MNKNAYYLPGEEDIHWQTRSNAANTMNSNIYFDAKENSNTGFNGTRVDDYHYLFFTGYFDLSFGSAFLNNYAGRLPAPVHEALNWSWRQQNGLSFLTINLAQTTPTFCGDAWAIAALHALNDRIKIKRDRMFPDIILSPQVLISCDKMSQGCKGGNPWLAYKFIFENYITSVLNSPVRNYGYTNGIDCSTSIFAKNCTQFDKRCSVPPAYHYFKLDSFGAVRGEILMMREIYLRGPIACGISISTGFESYTEGILKDEAVGDMTRVRTHAVEVIGYGEMHGEKFWEVRNSFGEYWGTNGTGFIRRGKNDFLIETAECAWAVPPKIDLEKMIHFTTAFETMDNKNRMMNVNPVEKHHTCRIFNGAGVHTITSGDGKAGLPESWDWRFVNGRNYITFHKNMNLPFYCGSCWAFGVAGMLSDRLNILIPELRVPVNLSVQMIINCAGAGHGCIFGDPLNALKLAQAQGLVDETCQEYTAFDKQRCESVDICHNCKYPGDLEHMGELRCDAVRHYTEYRISDYGVVSGVIAMKNEIYTHGPIECGIEIDWEIRMNYTGGVLTKRKPHPVPNHSVEVVGWNGNYWVAKNFWGDTWGINGYMHIEMGTNALGIESECTYGTVIEPQKRVHPVDVRRSMPTDHMSKMGFLNELNNPKGKTANSAE